MTMSPKSSTNRVAPRPRKKLQLLPAIKSTEFTSDKPAIQMNQLAPARTSCLCFAISAMAGGGPAGLRGAVVGRPLVPVESTRGRALWPEGLLQKRAAAERLTPPRVPRAVFAPALAPPQPSPPPAHRL